jgi:hypothetical protein
VTYVDSALLDLAERLCRKFQLLTGRTNVWLAVQFTNLSIVVYFVWAGLYFWNRGIGVRIAVGLFCGGLFYLLTETVFKEPIEVYENNAYRRVAKGLRNPRRVRDALLRISFLTLSLVLFGPSLFVFTNLRVHIVLLTYFLIVLTTIVLYLLACDPLAPCVGKLRQWIRGAVPSRAATGPVQTSNSTLTDSPTCIRRIASARSGAIGRIFMLGNRFSCGIGTVSVVTISTMSG